MSVTVMSRVFWTTIPPLGYKDKQGREVTVTPSTCKIVLLAIADSGNDEGENSWQSVDTLAQKSSLYDRSVIRATRALIENGYIRIDGLSRKRTNNYTINLDKLGFRPAKKARYGGVSGTPSDQWGSREGVSPPREGVLETLEGVSETPDSSLNALNPSIKEDIKAKSFWATIADHIKPGMPRQLHKYLDGCSALSWDGAILTVQAKDAEWMDQNIRKKAERFLVGLTASDGKVKFIEGRL